MARKRSRSTALARLLDAADTPICAFDASRSVIYGNPALAEWFDFPLDDLIGRRGNYSSQPSKDPLDELASALCPPASALAGQPSRSRLTVPLAEGGARTVAAEFLPLRGGDDRPLGVLVRLEKPSADPAVAPSQLDTDDITPAELHERLQSLRQQLGHHYAVQRLVGDSPAMVRVREQVQLAIDSPTRVLVVGPPGSGREHVARTIHLGRTSYRQQHGQPRDPASPDPPRQHPPLTPLDCRLLDAELLEATVTASLRHSAHQEATEPATLLLLDVDQLEAEAQAVLLGVLSIEEFEFRSLTTAAEPLDRLAEQGRFRPELAFALSTLTIELPGMADRASDIPLLVQMFLESLNAEGNRQLDGFSPEALDRLAAHDWTGNVDELAETVRQSCRWAKGPLVEVADLPDLIEMTAAAAARVRREPTSIDMDQVLGQIEAELLRRALKLAKGNKTKAAELLGIHRARLHRRIEQLGLDQEGFSGG